MCLHIDSWRKNKFSHYQKWCKDTRVNMFCSDHSAGVRFIHSCSFWLHNRKRCQVERHQAPCTHASGIQRAPGCFARVWKHPGSRTIWAWSLSLNESKQTHAEMKLERLCVRMRLLCVYSLPCCFLDSPRHVTSWPVLDLFIWNHLIWWATFCQNTVSLTVVRALCFSFDLLYCQGHQNKHTWSEALVLREAAAMNARFVLRCAAVAKRRLAMSWFTHAHSPVEAGGLHLRRLR